MVIHIGTSGWSYSHWRGPFYPGELTQEHMLEYYSRYFSSVEINNSFYHLPTVSTLTHWYETVPADFIFSVKASRYITHMKKLRDPEPALAQLYACVEILGDKLGPILFQLPPRWHCNPERLQAFLETLSREYCYVFELRDHSWLNEDIYSLLQQYDCALCIYDLACFESPDIVTTDFVYLRLHGPGSAYKGDYNESFLRKQAGRIRRWASRGYDVYCYFDNDEAGYAAANALRLQALAPHQIERNHLPTALPTLCN